MLEKCRNTSLEGCPFFATHASLCMQQHSRQVTLCLHVMKGVHSQVVQPQIPPCCCMQMLR